MRQNVYDTRTPQLVLVPPCRVVVGANGAPAPPLRGMAPTAATPYLQCTTSVDNYYQNTPLWSVPYRYCRSDNDCRKNTVDDKRCLPIDTSASTSCDAPGSCICTNAVWAAL